MKTHISKFESSTEDLEEARKEFEKNFIPYYFPDLKVVDFRRAEPSFKFLCMNKCHCYDVFMEMKNENP